MPHELHTSLEVATAERERLAELLVRAEEAYTKDLQEMLTLATESIDLATRLNERHAIADGLRLSDVANGSMGNHREAMKHLIDNSAGISKRSGGLVESDQPFSQLPIHDDQDKHRRREAIFNMALPAQRVP